MGMLDGDNLLKTALTAGGAVAGGVVGGPGGAMMGASLGGMASEVLFQPDIPEIPGASAEQKQMLGIQSTLAENALNIEGLSATEVSAVGQIGREVQQQQADKIASLPATMSSFDKQRMTEMLASQARKTQNTIESKIASLDPKAQMRNISMASDVTSRASIAANQVRQAEQQKLMYAAEQQRLKAEAFNASVSSLISGMGSAYAIGEKSGWGGDESGEILTNYQTEADLTLDDKELMAGLTDDTIEPDPTKQAMSESQSIIENDFIADYYTF